MKKIATILLLLLCFFTQAFAQFNNAEEEILAIVKSQDNISKHVFLDSTLLPNMKLYSGNTRQGWTSTDRDQKHIGLLYDIRLKFINHDSALSFHRRFQDINSEYGIELKDHQMAHQGADEFMVFTGAEAAKQMLEPQGLQMFCYLMVVDKYFAKVFITCDKNYKADKFQYLITEVISRIKK